VVLTIYGRKFREIRNKKNLPLSYFTRIGIDRSNLAKFERGEIMIGLDKLDACLSEMDVSLTEYELIINNFVPSYQEMILDIIDEKDYRRDTRGLKNIYNEAKGDLNRWLALVAKSCFTKLTEKEINDVINFLNKIEEWGYFELSIFYFVITELPIENIQKLLQSFDEKLNNHYNIFKYKRRILQIYYRAVAVYIKENRQDLAEKALKQASTKSNGLHDSFVTILKKLTESFYIYRYNSKEKGEVLIDKYLNYLEELDDKVVKDYYYRRFEEYIKY